MKTKILVGVSIAGALIGLPIFWLFPQHLIASFPFFVVSLGFWLASLHRFWMLLDGAQAGVTPKKSVLYLLIPIYNVFWLWKVWADIGLHFDRFCYRNKLRFREIPYLVPRIHYWFVLFILHPGYWRFALSVTALLGALIMFWLGRGFTQLELSLSASGKGKKNGGQK